MNDGGSVVVFDRSHASLRFLALVTEREPRFAKAVADWLDRADLPFLLLGSTSGAVPTLFALCARSTPHLLADMLERATALLAEDMRAGCLATAVDESLNELVAVAWSELLSLQPLPRTSYSRPPSPSSYAQTVGLSTRT